MAHRTSRSGTRSQPVKATQPFSLLEPASFGASSAQSASTSASPSSALANLSASTAVAGGSNAQRSPLPASTFGTVNGWRATTTQQDGRSHSPGSPSAKGIRLRRHGSPGTSPAPPSRVCSLESTTGAIPSPTSTQAFPQKSDENELRGSASHQRPGSVEIEVSQVKQSSRRSSVDSDLSKELESLCDITNDVRLEEKPLTPQDFGRKEPVAELLLSRRSPSSNHSQSSDNGHSSDNGRSSSGRHSSSSGQISPSAALRYRLSGSPHSMSFSWSPPEHLPRLRTAQPAPSGSHDGQLQGPDRSKVKMIFSRHRTAFRQCVPGVGEEIARQPSPVLVGNGAA